jgi:hypothetical protein
MFCPLAPHPLVDIRRTGWANPQANEADFHDFSLLILLTSRS